MGSSSRRGPTRRSFQVEVYQIYQNDHFLSVLVKLVNTGLYCYLWCLFDRNNQIHQSYYSTFDCKVDRERIMIGRQREQEELLQRFKRDRPEFIAIYGAGVSARRC